MAFRAIKISLPLINYTIFTTSTKKVLRVIYINSITTAWMAMMFLAMWRFFPCLLCIPQILQQAAGVLIITLEVEIGVPLAIL
jgi:hypothetical protein